MKTPDDKMDEFHAATISEIPPPMALEIVKEIWLALHATTITRVHTSDENDLYRMMTERLKIECATFKIQIEEPGT